MRRRLLVLTLMLAALLPAAPAAAQYDPYPLGFCFRWTWLEKPVCVILDNDLIQRPS